MTVAIFNKNSGSEKKRFLDALGAARSTLTKLRYATVQSKDGLLSQFRLTSKGLARDRLHRSEGRSKSALFDKLFKKYRSELEVEEIKETGEAEGMEEGKEQKSG
jgi:hypothetical protein